MKKFFMFAAMASVALASCVKNEPAMTVAQQDEIAFAAPVLAPNVKSAASLLNTIPTDSVFYVWGYFTQENFAGEVSTNEYMDDVQVTYQTPANVWKAAPAEGKYYWPTNGKLTFVGYSGAGVTNADVAATGLTFNYTAPNGTNDLLVSQVAYNLKKPAEGGADIVFDHALAAINFNVKSGIYYAESDPVKTDLRVTKIELLKVRKTGAFDQNFTTWTTGTQMPVASNSEGNLVPTAGWTVEENAETADYTAFSGTAVQLTNAYLPCMDDAGHNVNLIVLPQDIKNDVTLKITFDMKNDNMGANAWVTGQVATAQLNGAGVTAWQKGYKYTYNVTLTLEEITFDPVVSAWVDANVVEKPILTPDYDYNN